MRGMYRNRRKIWFANQIGTEPVLLPDGKPSGRTKPVFTNPIMVYANCSTTSGLTNNNITGKVKREPYGDYLDYNVTINPIPYGMESCTEESVLWIDHMPEIEPDGSTKTPYDHVITRKSYALNWEALQAVRVNRQTEGSTILGN